MRAEAQAVSADVWGVSKDALVRERTHDSPESVVSVPERWDPGKFAREQIRSLVRQLFFSSLKPVVKQVLFSAVESQSDVRGICTRVAACLARDAAANIVLVGADDESVEQEGRSEELRTENALLRERAVQIQRNLWYTPSNWAGGKSTSSIQACLSELRRDFDYSIIVGPSATESSEGTAMAQFADGIVLVLSAGRTRRAAACRIKKLLIDAQVRLLGVVLSDREFPIPDRIYRRL